jgi:hypothetical protein
LPELCPFGYSDDTFFNHLPNTLARRRVIRLVDNSMKRAAVQRQSYSICYVRHHRHNEDEERGRRRRRRSNSILFRIPTTKSPSPRWFGPPPAGATIATTASLYAWLRRRWGLVAGPHDGDCVLMVLDNDVLLMLMGLFLAPSAKRAWRVCRFPSTWPCNTKDGARVTSHAHVDCRPADFIC